MGSNDFYNSKNTYADTVQVIQAAKARGLNVIVVSPNPDPNHRYATVAADVARAAKDLECPLEVPQSFDPGQDFVHLTMDEAKRIAQKYPGALITGDSTAVRIGLCAGFKTNDIGTELLDSNGNVVAKVGASTMDISKFVDNQMPSSRE